jgi:hypothetical protein
MKSSRWYSGGSYRRLTRVSANQDSLAMQSNRDRRSWEIEQLVSGLKEQGNEEIVDTDYM